MKKRSSALLLLTPILLLGLGCRRAGPPPSTTAPPSESSQRPVAQIEAGTKITITNCRPEPQLLQTREGEEVTFVNNDEQSHSIFVLDQTIKVAAKSSTTITVKVPPNIPVNFDFTENYLCDGQLSGALYIPASR